MTKSRHHVYPKRHRTTDNPNRGEIKMIPYAWHKAWHIIFADLNAEQVAERLKEFLPSDVEIVIRRNRNGG